MATAAAPTPTATLRVFLVEDSELIRARIRAELATIPGLRTVGHADTAADAIRDVLAQHPDVVLLDLRLREGTGMDVLRALHASAPEIDVYLCSSYAAEPYRGMALRLGARAVFDKSTEFGRVKETLARRAASLH
jgi:DNA-binding NarL/FixJ family response regulator